MDRTGLYLMIIWLLFFGPCSMNSAHQDIQDRLERIEQAVGVAPASHED